MTPDPAEVLFALLRELAIATETRSHPPVFTVEQARANRPEGEVGVHVKNLFVRNKKGSQWLVTVAEDRRVDLGALALALGTKHLSFASHERLRAHLGVEPGSVTPLAAINDRAGQVVVVLEASLADEPVVHCHPLTNDRTTALAGADLVRFLHAVGHPPVWVTAEALGAH